MEKLQQEVQLSLGSSSDVPVYIRLYEVIKLRYYSGHVGQSFDLSFPSGKLAILKIANAFAESHPIKC